MATYELKRSEVYDVILRVLKRVDKIGNSKLELMVSQNTNLAGDLIFSDSDLYKLAAEICDEIGIEPNIADEIGIEDDE